ncbi:MAG: ATP synthase F1 subunit epsilon [Ardenticatenia bacterium]|nr:ATP synthase F1 subunit epsilon [Ardenticatenia bacterium]
MTATLSLEIVTIERKVYEADDVEMIIAPGVEGEMGILPRHTPVLTALRPGELIIRRSGGVEEPFAIGGGFMEVHPTKVIVLADTAEHVDEIDVERAEAARRRAEQMLREGPPPGGPSLAEIRQSLMRHEVRIKIVRRRRRYPGAGPAAGTPPAES